MQLLILFLITTVMSVQYLIGEGWLPSILKYAPEILGMTAALIVVVAGIRDNFRSVRPVYWLIFSSLAIVMACGAVANQLQPGPMFAGFRFYLWSLPFFFLPMVTFIRERELRIQLLLLLAFCFVQIPIAWDQRQMTTFVGETTGDWTTGTLVSATWLTLYQMGGAAVLAAFYIRKRIPLALYVLLTLVILVPTMLNESKAAIFILPAALLTVFILGAEAGQRLKHGIVALGVLACFFAIFIPVYDHFMKPRWGYGIVDFFLMEGRMEGYLDRGAEVGDLDQSPGNWGSLKIVFSELSRDPVQFVFGVGIGNTADSALGSQFHGEYYYSHGRLITSSMATVMMEFGFGGLMLLMLLFVCIFRDTLALSRQDKGLFGVFALGWAGVIVVIFIGFGYHGPIQSRALSALFWYFSGLIASQHMRVTLGANIPRITAHSEARTSLIRRDI